MPVRSEPFHNAEQINQLLFGERAEVLEINDRDWARIRSEWDEYEGWCKVGQLAFVSRKDYRKGVKFIATGNSNKLILENGEIWIPNGSDLFGLKAGKIPMGEDRARYKGKKTKPESLELTCDTVVDAAKLYLNAPYQWGGRSVAGIDCSGLTQMAFKMCGKPLHRDASQQALEGEAVDFLQHAHCGDLAFFDNAEGKITHVGILIDSQTIIHATDTSGRVVIDRIDQGGIISRSLRKRTHHLRFVKRFINTED